MSERKEHKQREEIEYFLTKLHLSPTQLKDYQLLQGGVSGATTYRLQMVDRDVICKITRTDSESYVLERALRELSFYEKLASRLQIQVPQVLASVHDSRGIALLLSAYQPSISAAEWQKTDYIQIARQIGLLHKQFWGQDEQMSCYPWLNRPRGKTASKHLQLAMAQWEALQEDSPLASHIPKSHYQNVINLFTVIEQVDNLLTDLPMTLCHGDCHADNVLRNEQAHFVWADWQEVGIGFGPTDLSFFVQRAFFSGGAIPYKAMVANYYQQLEGKISLAFLQDMMTAIELRAWLLDWPFYLQYASPERLSKLLNRIALLSKLLHFH